MLKHKILKEELNKLYIIENKSVNEVAEYYGCSRHTIIFYMRKYKIRKDRKNVAILIGNTLEKRTGYRTPAANPETLEKIKNTNLKKYDSKFVMQNDNFVKKVKITKKIKYGDENYNNTEKRKETCLKKYGVENAVQNKEIHLKIENTLEEKTGYRFAMQDKETKEKAMDTCFKHYGVKNPMQNKDIASKNISYQIELYGGVGFASSKIQEKIRQTNLKRYGVENPTQDPVIREKQWATKKIRGTTNVSKPEDDIYALLLTKFPQIQRNHSTDLYPFHCDFYIPSLDLYIEYQGTWTHGKEPFDFYNPEHLAILEKWKKKAMSSKFYKVAVNVWTRRDPLKREVAKKNNLNWLEFFTFEEFTEWFNQLK